MVFRQRAGPAPRHDPGVHEWRAQTRRELTEVGVEVDVDGVLETRTTGGRVGEFGCAAGSTGWNETPPAGW